MSLGNIGEGGVSIGLGSRGIHDAKELSEVYYDKEAALFLCCIPIS